MDHFLNNVAYYDCITKAIGLWDNLDAWNEFEDIYDDINDIRHKALSYNPEGWMEALDRRLLRT